MAKTRTKKPRLGRGLSSLMANPVSVQPPPDTRTPTLDPADTADPTPPTRTTPAPAPAAESPDPGQAVRYIPVDAITPNPHQPRQTFDADSLDQLAASIRQDGLMQPIVVRPAPAPAPAPASGGLPGAPATTPPSEDTYEIVAGERRWRAARLPELDRNPAIVRELSDRQVAEWALIENLQREDLDPIERGLAFRRLIDQFQLSHEQIADRVGLARPSVANLLRLLELPAYVQQAVRRSTLTAGHARALLPLDDQQAQAAMADRAVKAGWSVRTLEAAVRRAMEHEPTSTGPRARSRSPHLVDLEQQIARQLQTRVRLKPGRKKGSGSITIEYFNLDQFDDLLNRLGVNIE